MRNNDKIIPLNAPWICKLSTAYCEHVGMNLHFGPKNGEMYF